MSGADLEFQKRILGLVESGDEDGLEELAVSRGIDREVWRAFSAAMEQTMKITSTVFREGTMIEEAISRSIEDLAMENEKKIEARVRAIAREEVASLCGLVLRRLQEPGIGIAQIFGEALRDFGGTDLEPGDLS